MRCMLKSDDLFKVSFNPCAINCAERVLVTRKGCQGKWSLYALTTDVGKRWILKRKNLANLKWSFRCSIKIKIKLCSVTVQHSTCHIFFSHNKFSPLSPSCGFSVLSFGWDEQMKPYMIPCSCTKMVFWRISFRKKRERERRNKYSKQTVHNVEYAMLNQSTHVVQLMNACHLMLMCHLHPKIVKFSNETLLHDHEKESLCAVKSTFMWKTAIDLWQLWLHPLIIASFTSCLAVCFDGK